MAVSTYAMSVNTNISGQFASNILHFDFDDAGYGTTANAAKNLCDGWVAGGGHGAMAALVSVHTTFLSLRARKINSTGGFEGGHGFAAGTTGARIGNLSAAGLSCCLILIPQGNAKERGRIFLPGLSDADCTNGIFTAAFITALGANVPTFLAPFVLAGGGAPTAQIKLYSRKLRLTRGVEALNLSYAVAQVRRRQRPI